MSCLTSKSHDAYALNLAAAASFGLVMGPKLATDGPVQGIVGTALPRARASWTEEQ